MILVKPSFEILTPELHIPFGLAQIEKAGRTCYKSAMKDAYDETIKFIGKLVKSGHESVIEHFNLTVKFTVDRGVTHELVRHRIASYSQESTRYCNYHGAVTFVIPPWVDLKPRIYLPSLPEWHLIEGNDKVWIYAMLDSEVRYTELLNKGWTPQQARSVLPNSTKTEIVMTANLREWRHVLKLRTSKAAHPQMREIMIPLLKEFRKLIPVVFNDIGEGNEDEKK
jgi:thymidylate synthase (FAD)